MGREPVGRPRPSRVGLILGLLVGLAQVGLWTQIALAHANLVSADPPPDAVLATSPSKLTLTFDSALADSGNGVALYRSDRSAVGSPAPTIMSGKQPRMVVSVPTLPPDVYTVAWTSVSGEDGHVLNQFYALTIGQVPAAMAPPDLPPLAVGDTRVTLKLGRGDVGPTTIAAVVSDAGGKPLTNLQRVIYRYQPMGLKIGEDEIFGPAQGSAAQTPTFTLGLSGTWQLQVIVRRAGLDDVMANTQVTLAPAPGAAPSPTATAVAPPIPTATAPEAIPTATAAPATPTLAPTPAAVATATTAIPTTTPVPTAVPVAAPSPAGPSATVLVAGAAALVVLLAAGGLLVRRR